MTPDDLCTVQRSWAELADRHDALLPVLSREFELGGVETDVAGCRARWLLDAVAELVDLLPAPSRLADRARAIGQTWPHPLTAPSYCVDGRAWMTAAAQCAPTWSDRTADAWRQAWLLLSEELAAESLSPFCD